MMERGPHFLHWVPGDHTRLAGKMQFHYRLAFDGEGRPMFQVFNTCRHFIRTLPNLVYDESNVEDIDTRQEDHIYDECRYVLMENPISRPGRPCSLRWGTTRWSCTGGRGCIGCSYGKALLCTTSQSRIRSTAPLVGEPLAKPGTCGDCQGSPTRGGGIAKQ